jgi:hypothetical protein
MSAGPLVCGRMPVSGRSSYPDARHQSGTPGRLLRRKIERNRFSFGACRSGGGKALDQRFANSTATCSGFGNQHFIDRRRKADSGAATAAGDGIFSDQDSDEFFRVLVALLTADPQESQV